MQKLYIHVIHLTPLFDMSECNIVFDTYNSNLCYGLITAEPLPEICGFPIYVNAGQISVDFKVNQSTTTLTQEQIALMRRFHVFIFSEVLRILPTFLMLDTAAMLVVPILRDTCQINFDVIERHETIEPVEEPNRNTKASLQVTAENYLGKIVTPWYRTHETVNLPHRLQIHCY